MGTYKQSGARRHRRIVVPLLSLLLLALILPLIPYAVAELGDRAGKVVNPGSELWRDVRQRDSSVTGTTQVKGVETGTLINVYGEEWRNYRMRQLAPWGALVLGAMLGIFILYYLIRGKIRIEAGRSGQLLRRYTTPEMVVHWLLATSFVILALSGLILLYGRWALIPLLGPAGFSLTATVCKNLHNYVGLFFAVIVPIAFFLYLKDSLFNLKVDLKWFKRLGGYFGGEEPSAEKVNAGQKSWYWVAMLGGFVLIIQWPGARFSQLPAGTGVAAGRACHPYHRIDRGHRILHRASLPGDYRCRGRPRVDDDRACRCQLGEAASRSLVQGNAVRGGQVRHGRGAGDRRKPCRWCRESGGE